MEKPLNNAPASDIILTAPAEFWKLDSKEKKRICNGIGPKGLGWLFPNTVWGLNVKSCGDIHDYMYHIGKYQIDKEVADNVFLNNLQKLIKEKTKKQWLLNRRLFRAEIMYTAVKHFGNRAFWKNKGGA